MHRDMVILVSSPREFYTQEVSNPAHEVSIGQGVQVVFKIDLPFSGCAEVDKVIYVEFKV